MRCTAPVQGHRSASARANCPACRSGSRSYASYTSYTRPPSYPAPAPQYRGSGSGPSSGGSRRRSAGGLLYTVAEDRTLAPVRQAVERQAESYPAQSYPDRYDLFLCHAWGDRQGAAKELNDLLVALDVKVWFSEVAVKLGTSLVREIDRGLSKSRAGIVLVTPELFTSLNAQGIADKELSALLATDLVIPVAHGTTFEALRDVSPLLAARSGLSTESSSLEEVAAKIAETVDVDD
ncbi:TIR domain-containing protein [Rhodococcus opacus]|nr:toll/interleukin-1 receptor domain-containing protein [Rhodococcus opacus]NKY75759.1 TIR domain-containing protein [Rhodococcus opacus]